MESDELSLSVRHLIICREALYDPLERGAAFSLRSLIIHLQPDDDIGYPLSTESLVLFAQVYGEAGVYRLRADLILVDDDGAEKPISTFGPFVAHVRPRQFIDSVWFPLYKVTFPQPGLYEFQLRRDGTDELLASERLLLKD